MSGIEFLFSFYSLLLGLAVANVVTGFAESWQMRHRTSLGWSSLLLGILILLRAAEQWLSVSAASSGGLTMTAWTVLTSMGMALPYIFISKAMLPREQDHCTHLDGYYLQNSRALMLALAIPPAVSLVHNLAAFGTAHMSPVYSTIKHGIPLLVPIALSFSKRLWLHRVGLALLVVMILVLMLGSS